MGVLRIKYFSAPKFWILNFHLKINFHGVALEL